MTRSNKFLMNTIASAIYQVVVAVVGIILPRIVMLHYGSEINGLVTSISQIASYFAIVEAGLSGAAVFSLYKPIADRDDNTVSGIVAATQKFYVKSGCIFAALILAMSLLYPFAIKINRLNNIEITLLVMILGVSGAIDFFTLGKYRALLTADQRLYVISFASICYCILNTSIVFALAMLEVNIVIVRAIALLAVFLRTAILCLYCKKKYPSINYKAEPNNAALDKRWDAFYLQLLGGVQQGTPIIILTFMTQLVQVSVYSVYNMVMGGISSILDVFMSGLSSSFGEVLAQKEQKTFENAYGDFEIFFYALIAIVFSVAMLMIEPFITIYTAGITDAVYVSANYAFWCVLNGFIYQIKTPEGMLVISAGQYRETKVQSTIQASIIIVGGLLFAPNWGIVGMWIAMILSNIYRDIDLLLYAPKHITSLPLWRSAKRKLICIITFVLTVVSGRLLFDLSAASYLGWALKAGLCCLLAAAITLVVDLVFDHRQMRLAMQRLKNVLHKK